MRTWKPCAALGLLGFALLGVALLKPAVFRSALHLEPERASDRESLHGSALRAQEELERLADVLAIAATHRDAEPFSQDLVTALVRLENEISHGKEAEVYRTAVRDVMLDREQPERLRVLMTLLLGITGPAECVEEFRRALEEGSESLALAATFASFLNPPNPLDDDSARSNFWIALLLDERLFGESAESFAAAQGLRGPGDATARERAFHEVRTAFESRTSTAHWAESPALRNMLIDHLRNGMTLEPKIEILLRLDDPGDLSHLVLETYANVLNHKYVRKIAIEEFYSIASDVDKYDFLHDAVVSEQEAAVQSSMVVLLGSRSNTPEKKSLTLAALRQILDSGGSKLRVVRAVLTTTSLLDSLDAVEYLGELLVDETTTQSVQVAALRALNTYGRSPYVRERILLTSRALSHRDREVASCAASLLGKHLASGGVRDTLSRIEYEKLLVDLRASIGRIENEFRRRALESLLQTAPD